jgi:hypothetical protein
MASTITPDSIDQNFPIPNVDNDSQGFRTNFAITKQSLLTAKQEINAIHGQTISISSSTLTGSSTSFNPQNPVVLTLDLNNLSPSSAGVYTTSGNNLSLTIDTKGRVTNITPTAISLPLLNPGTYNQSIDSNGNLIGTNITVDSLGRITTIASTTIANYGLINSALTKGNLIVGDTLNKSSALPVGNDGQVLVARPAEPQGVKWEDAVLSGGGSSIEETVTYTPSNAQTLFTLPSDCQSVVRMLINGQTTISYTYNNTTKVLTFDPVGNGFGIETTDEVVVKYKTSTSGVNNLLFTIAPTTNQTLFQLPLNASIVVGMFINGQGTNDYSFNANLKQVTLNTSINGYTIEANDEILFLYTPTS